MRLMSRGEVRAAVGGLESGEAGKEMWNRCLGGGRKCESAKEGKKRGKAFPSRRFRGFRLAPAKSLKNVLNF
jgi:hypothetical protein